MQVLSVEHEVFILFRLAASSDFALLESSKQSFFPFHTFHCDIGYNCLWSFLNVVLELIEICFIVVILLSQFIKFIL